VSQCTCGGVFSPPGFSFRPRYTPADSFDKYITGKICISRGNPDRSPNHVLEFFHFGVARSQYTDLECAAPPRLEIFWPDLLRFFLLSFSAVPFSSPLYIFWCCASSPLVFTNLVPALVVGFEQSAFCSFASGPTFVSLWYFFLDAGEVLSFQDLFLATLMFSPHLDVPFATHIPISRFKKAPLLSFSSGGFFFLFDF